MAFELDMSEKTADFLTQVRVKNSYSAYFDD